MIMTRSALLAFTLLLSATATSTATRVMAPAPSVGSMQEDENPPSPLFPIGGNTTQCLNAVNKVENCFTELLTSVLSFRFHVSKECCSAVTNASSNCLPLVRPFFSTQLQSFCSALEGSAPV